MYTLIMIKQRRNNPSSFDDEISLLNLIQFFKTNFKIIVFFIFIGGTLGGLYEKFASPIYKGEMILYPPKISGRVLENPEIILSRIKLNSYFSKEVLLACNPAYKDRDYKYKLSDTVKISISKNNLYFIASMSNESVERISGCLGAINNHFVLKQILPYKSNTELLEAQLEIAKNKLQIYENMKKGFMSNSLNSTKNEVLYNIFMLDALNMNDQILKIKTELSASHTNIFQGQDLVMNIQEEVLLSRQSRIFLGLFLGGILGLFIVLLRDIFQSMKA
jgi:hypothetical protein